MGSRVPDGPYQSQRKGRKPAPRETGCKLQQSKNPRDLRNGSAVLGEDELRFRTDRTGRHGSDFHLHIPYSDIESIEVDAHSGQLSLTTREHGDVVLHLGRHAVEWKRLIEEQGSGLLDELGVKRGSKVALLAVLDPELERELGERVPDLDPEGTLDVAFLGVEHRSDLAGIPALAARLRTGGGLLWLVHPEDVLPEADFTAAARNAGLTPAGEVRLSRSHLALKLRRS
ncbi:MAG: hypothetical protein IT370_13400 [Deltaproteobacteria bacterium]|nr:hypothetical protein [Deltaproteobacteria bacterium]